MIDVSIAGASGYSGGELIRLLLGHPGARLGQLTSERYAGKAVHRAHPNLRGATALKFSALADLEACDCLFLCLPHGRAMNSLDDAGAFEKWYGEAHACPERLQDFVYGIPEVNRERIRGAARVTGAGCNATATILALRPLYRRGLVAQAVVEVKAGSSEGGNAASDASHHPERSGAVRSYKPTGHRHIAEMLQVLGSDANISFSATSIEMVRGILATCHVFLKQPLSEKDVWKIYREDYAAERFVRIVKERGGIYRYPEPKLLSGSNFCDIGFELDPHGNRLVVLAAIDNLMKGAAGQALQAFNLMHGLDEDTGLGFTGLHPI